MTNRIGSLKAKRDFLAHRLSLVKKMTKQHVVAKENTNSGHKCAQIQRDFKNACGTIITEAEQMVLNLKGKVKNAKNLVVKSICVHAERNRNKAKEASL